MYEQATLTTEPTTVGGLRATHWLLTCGHGRTELTEAPGAIPGSRDDVARSVLRDHVNAYGCECSRLLWDRYFPVGASD